MSADCPVILLDIEGTVSPVAFVYDVMFPYARKHAEAYLANHWDEASVQETVQRIAEESGFAHGQAVLAGVAAGSKQEKAAVVAQAVHRLMDADAKVTGLKALQGMIWRDGFESGELVAQLFPDVVPVLEQWRDAGKRLAIYSSGSVAAQKLFFGHTTTGDLLPLFESFFDTEVGGKKEAASYVRIAQALEEQPQNILFVSDVVAELDAARESGLRTVLRVPDGEGDAITVKAGHDVIESFVQLLQ